MGMQSEKQPGGFVRLENLNNSEPINSTCPYCGVGCGISVHALADQKYSVQGDAFHPANAGKLCSKGSQLSATLTDEGRMLSPSIGGEEASWPKALDHIAEKISHSIENYGQDSVAFYLSGQILTEDYYVANKLMKGFIGSANVDTNSRLCMSSAVAAYKRAFGSDTVPTNYEDIEQTDLIVLVGSNAAWTHPILFQKMRQAQQNKPGYKMVVIDPKRTATASSADLHLAIKPGTDGMLFNGLLAYLKRSDKLDEAYIAKHTHGFFDALEACPETLTEVALFCGISENQLRQFYDWFANSQKSISFYSMGVNQSNSGTDKCNAIINVHLATGKIGKPGCGPFSITGQPNAMGGREVGGLANMLAAHMDFSDKHIDTVSRFWRTNNTARAPGLKALDMFSAIESDKIKVLWIMGTNPAVSLPDSNRTKKILKNCDCVIVSDCMAKTDTTALADVLLPATTWGEKNGTVTNSERRISRQRPFRKAPGQARHDWWAITEVAKRLGYTDAFNYQHPSEIFSEHAQLSGYENNGTRDFDISGLAHLTQEQYNELQPIQWPVNDAYPLGRAHLFENGKFYSENGKAKFIAIAPQLPKLNSNQNNTLILNTGRGRDQWHTMTRTSRSAKLNTHELLPQLCIHRNDAKKHDIAAGDLVQISNELGTIKAIADITEQQKPGECFVSIHWNEQFVSSTKANNLMAFIADPFSGQPQYKQARVNIKRISVDRWQTLLTQNPLPKSESLYCVNIPIKRGFLQVQALVDQASVENRLEKVIPPDKTLTYHNRKKHIERIAGIEDDLISFISLTSKDSPVNSIDKLVRLFESGHCDAKLEMSLLTHSTEQLGQRICACFEVSKKDITDFMDDNNDATQEDIEQTLRCGTNCGSCKPEVERVRTEYGYCST